MKPFPRFEDFQRVPHWQIGTELGILDLESGAKFAGSMFPLFRGAGARLLRSLGSFALNAHMADYEEIRPPSFALTETMMSTGHLPKSVDDMYAIERDDLWAIPTAEVPLTSMNRGEILDERQLPLRMTAQTACFRREAGSAGRDTRGLFARARIRQGRAFRLLHPRASERCVRGHSRRAESLLQAWDSRIECSTSARGTSAHRPREPLTWRYSARAWIAGSRSRR